MVFPAWWATRGIKNGVNDKALENCLEDRLQESYAIYMEIISDMNEAVEDLKKALCLDKASLRASCSHPKIINRGGLQF